MDASYNTNHDFTMILLAYKLDRCVLLLFFFSFSLTLCDFIISSTNTTKQLVPGSKHLSEETAPLRPSEDSTISQNPPGSSAIKINNQTRQSQLFHLSILQHQCTMKLLTAIKHERPTPTSLYQSNSYWTHKWMRLKTWERERERRYATKHGSVEVFNPSPAFPVKLLFF